MRTQASTSTRHGTVLKVGEAETKLRTLSKDQPRLMKIFSALALGALNPDYIAGMLPGEALFEVQQNVAPKPTESSFSRALKSLVQQGLVRNDVLISLDDTAERGILPTHAAQLAWEKLRKDSSIVLVEIPTTIRGFRERLTELPVLDLEAKKALRVLALAHLSGQVMGLSASEVAEQLNKEEPHGHISAGQIGQMFRSDVRDSPFFVSGSELIQRLRSFVPSRWAVTDFGLLAFEKKLFDE